MFETENASVFSLFRVFIYKYVKNNTIFVPCEASVHSNSTKKRETKRIIY